MTTLRVLRLSNSAVVPEYRERERALCRLGYDMHLVSPPDFAEGGSVVRATTDSEIPVHVVPTRGRRHHPILFWYLATDLRRVIRTVRPDLIDLHQEPYSLATAAALRVIDAAAPGTPVCIYTAQNIHKRYPQPFRHFENRALQRSAAAYPCSVEAGDVLRRKGYRGHVHVIPLGVSLRTTAPRRSGTNALRVGFLGRLEPYKGGMVALEAFAAAGVLDAVLEIVGDGSQRRALEARASALGVAGRVRFIGAVSQDAALDRIATYDVVLVPSLTTPTWKEQFGRVPAQAMEAGTPIIASDSGSLVEVLGGAGTIVPEGDVHATAERLRGLLLDPEARGRLSALGRQRAVEHLSWASVAAATDSMYRKALRDVPRGRASS